eukprot:13606040-Heterocapsa_arctica.AAC.1
MDEAALRLFHGALAVSERSNAKHFRADATPQDRRAMTGFREEREKLARDSASAVEWFRSSAVRKRAAPDPAPGDGTHRPGLAAGDTRLLSELAA